MANFYLFYPPSSSGSSGVQHVIVDSSALPTGASTSANQATEIASLSSIDSKLTSPLAVTGPLTDTQLRATPVPISGTVTATISGVATAANQATEIASLASIDSKLTSPITVTGGLTDTQLRATPVPVSGTVTTGGLTDTQLRASPVPVSGTVTANAGTNLNTSALALETTQVAMSAKLPAALGQAASAASLAVVLASDQSSIPVAATLQTGSNTIGALTANQSVNVNQIAGTATAVNTGNASAGTQRVVIATDQPAFSVNVTNSPSTLSQIIPVSGSSNAASSSASTALTASQVVKASPGRLYQLTGVNTKLTAQYIQVFNSTTVPADTTVPILLAYVPAGANFSFDFGAIGRYFSTGISVSNSSTAATKTIGSADCWFNAEYL